MAPFIRTLFQADPFLFMSAPRLLAVSILFLALADLWLAFPQIDLAVASLFSTPEDGFVARGALWEQFMYGSIDELLVIVGLGLIGAWIIGRRHASAGDTHQNHEQRAQHSREPVARETSRDDHDSTEARCACAVRTPIHRRVSERFIGSVASRVTGRRLAFLLLLLMLVPGLLVNQVFKEHWGRARPIQLEQFGGHRTFSPAFVVSDQGGGAFSSGHVAAAAWLVAVPVVLFEAGPVWTGLALLYLLAMVLARMAAGAHFLSDTLTSILLVWLGFLILQRLLPSESPSELSNEPSNEASSATGGKTSVERAPR